MQGSSALKNLLSLTPSVYKQAYELGFSLRRKGLTIPTVDLIIAALAIENKSLFALDIQLPF
jgi:predicted nucleic acid-binding protein